MGRRCLIVGASGQLGRALCTAFHQGHQVVEAVHRAPQPGQWPVDLANPTGTVSLLRKLRPEWILIAGAFCNVDQAETKRAVCFATNLEGPLAIAQYAQAHGCTVVYYSTDSVFDGAEDRYIESDPVSPLNVYSQSKAQGEVGIRTLLPDRHLILRTAWLYGPEETGQNFILRLIGELRAGRQVLVPSDQWGSPTYAADLAAATRLLLEGPYRGTFHATGPEIIDRASLARCICEHFDLDSSGIRAVPTRELGQAARRPSRVQLDCHKLRSVGIEEFRNIAAGLNALKRWLEGSKMGVSLVSRGRFHW